MHLATCTISGQQFYISDKETAFCERLGVPLPTTSPIERMRTLMAFRNEWKLYKRKCDATGQDIISAYPPDSPFKVYNNTTWWGDSWDPLEYGRDYDPSRSFFEQYKELQLQVPREGTSIFNSENCDYNSHTRQSKNCFLNSLVARCEDTHYSYWVVENKDVLDSMYTNKSTLCYFCSDVNNCYNCVMLQESSDCNDCFFSYQLKGCSNCIFSSNLVNASYRIFNKPCTKEEFETTKKKLLSGSWTAWQEAVTEFLKMRAETTQQNVHMLNSENATGDHIYNCKDCEYCFDSFNSEDCANSISLDDSKDIHSSYSAGWPRCEVVYNSCVSRGSTDIAFCTYTWASNNLRYCDSCISSKDCFGCIGLRHKQYCILNKQYTKEQYEELLPEIIAKIKEEGHWGEFFPQSISPYTYNETPAMDFFPLTKEEALSRGWQWRDADIKDYQPATLSSIPDSIHELADSITKEVLSCELCKKNYRIIPQELKFYKQMGLPIPRNCSACRHAQKMKMRNPPLLWLRQCGNCGVEMYSSFEPTRLEKVFCQNCYRETVY